MEAITGAAQSLAAISGVRAAAPVEKPEAPSSSAPEKPAPVMDEYVPEEEHTPSGLYWVGRGEDGSPKVFFDDPEAKPAETCTASTDQVDREIKALKKRQEQLEQQLASAPDGTQAQELERKLAQVEQELSQKDNDNYRRQNAVFS